MILSRIVLVTALCCAGSPLALAKRIAPKEVPPVVHAGIEYSVPLGADKLGIVRAREEAGGKVLWEQKIYEVEFNPKLERDVQWVFISDLKMEGKSLIITDERNRRYALNPETREVRPLADGGAAAVTAGPVEVVQGFVVTDPGAESPDDLRVLMYLRNTQKKPLKLLTRNLQVDLFSFPNKPTEMCLTLSAQKVIDGSKVIPSEHDLSPVVLDPGEVAEIRIAHRDQKDLKQVVLVYDMRNDIARRYGAWSGQVRGPMVKVTKSGPGR